MPTIQEKIAVMQHYANGGAVEWQYVGDPLFHDNTRGWNRLENAHGTAVTDFNWTNFNYRIGKKKVKGWIAINPKQYANSINLIHHVTDFYTDLEYLKQRICGCSSGWEDWIIKEIEIEAHLDA